MKREELFNRLLKEEYKENGKSFNLALIPEKHSKQVIAYGSMKADLKSVLDYMNELKKTKNETFSAAFMYSAISLYGRCFTASKDYTQLNLDKVFEKEPSHKQNHEFLRDLRDCYVAHRRRTGYELGATFIAVSKKNNSKAKMTFHNMRMTRWSEREIDNLMKTVRFVLNHVEKKFEKCGIKLYDYFLKNYTPEEINNFMINSLFE